MLWSSALSKNFESLGLVNLFDPTKSELRGIGPHDTISIDEVSHYAQLKINEAGIDESEDEESENKGEFKLFRNLYSKIHDYHQVLVNSNLRIFF